MSEEGTPIALDCAILRGVADAEAGRVHDIEDVERVVADEIAAVELATQTTKGALSKPEQK